MIRQETSLRYDKDHKEDVHRTIVEFASARFRKDGLAAVGVRKLMTEAGLTHGGFYGHFPSRTALVAEALASALDETLSSLTAAVTKAPEGKSLEAFVDSYLDPRHRDMPDRGCAGTSLAPEISRENSDAAAAFDTGLSRIVALLADQLPGETSKNEVRTDRAWAVFSLLMGAIQLSRTRPVGQASDAILAAARNSALSLARLPL